MSTTNIQHKFTNTLRNAKYLFGITIVDGVEKSKVINGKEANFINGDYYTANPEEIYQLQAEIVAGHPHLGDGGEVDMATLDPLAELKAKAIAEYIASQEAANLKTNDRGDTASAAELKARLAGIASSANIAQASANSTSAA